MNLAGKKKRKTCQIKLVKNAPILIITSCEIGFLIVITVSIFAGSLTVSIIIIVSHGFIPVVMRGVRATTSFTVESVVNALKTVKAIKKMQNYCFG